MRNDGCYYVIIGRDERGSVAGWMPAAVDFKRNRLDTDTRDNNKNLWSHRAGPANPQLVDTLQNPLPGEAAA